MASPTFPRTERRILGGAVRRLREAKSIKQDTLALAAGVHPAYLSNIERNKKQPSVERMLLIANSLGVDLDDISYMTLVVVVADEADRISA